MPEVRFTLTLPKIPLLAPDAGTSILRREVGSAVQGIVEQVADASRQAAPVATGILRASIGTRVTPGTDASTLVRGEVFTGAQAPYAQFVAEGTRPHFPPIAPLKIWARIVLGDERAAYRVARVIARRGTRANVRFRQAISTFPPDTQARLDAAVARAALLLSPPGS